MRIISGTHKGRRITAPKNLPVRPTTDMAKEALFNILDNRYYLEDLCILDLFAGTGNISYEFASRGTRSITAVDKHYGCVRFINQISDDFEFGIHAVKADVFTYLNNSSTTYDVVFADPPYDMDQEDFETLAQSILKYITLNEDGLIIIEHSKHTSLNHIAGFYMMKKYGGNCFSFFKKADL